MDEPRTISKKAYFRLTMALTLLTCAVATLAANVLVSACGGRIEPGLLAGLTGLYIILARALAEWILRLRDLTRRGTSVEIHARSLFGPTEDVAPGETVEARVPPGTLLFLLCGAPVMVLICYAGAWVFEEQIWMRCLSIGMGFFFLACFVENIVDYGKPIARVDADGVNGYPSHRALWRRFVPWSDVYSCEVQTLNDTFGKPILLRPVLKGRHGEKLMALCLFYTPMVEQERIVKAIKTRLPETEVDAWLT
ncbi:hypothetical protein [Paludisphaera mucosa]|uniref:Uncharacterized protein n=1 Tax=Paludisphaera mucosa TaxID=3030827 RepID=A0ABT6FC68_9BACT|nr:hypothetical protein [Paludisphaera mucosa]MDG3004993.1 hypothetical protein [Paludisphaera mucosa]